MPEIPSRPELAKLKSYLGGMNVEEALKVAPGTKPIKLASNENPLGPSPKAIDAMRMLEEEVAVYPDQNATLLREAIAARYDLKPENVIIGNGSDEIMLMIGLAFLSAGEESIISRATFSIYEFVTSLLGGNPVFVEQKQGKYDMSAFQKKISKKARLVWISNPNNPTGTYVNDTELRAFLKSTPNNIQVILDEAYAEYSETKDFPDSRALLKEFPQLIVLRTFSKAYGLAGVRVGYGLASSPVIHTLNKTRLPFNVNRVAQGAALAALEDDDHIQRSQKNNLEGKKYLYAELEIRNISYWKTEANFICLELPGKSNADKVFMEIMKKGVVVRPLTSFGLPKHIRVTIGTPEQNEKFIQALSEVIG